MEPVSDVTAPTEVSATDFEVANAKAAVDAVLTAYEKIVDFVARATIDHLGGVFDAHALSLHEGSKATKTYLSHLRKWAHKEANTIDESHRSKLQHGLNIAGGLVQTLGGGYFAMQMLGRGINEAEIRRLTGLQQQASAMGQLGQQFGAGVGSWNEATRAISQSVQGAETTDKQNGGQDASTMANNANEAVSKKGQAAQARHGAFESMAR